MTRNEILDKLRAIMARTSQASVDWNSVGEQSTIESLGIDSLAMLDLMYDLQQEFGIEFEPQDLVKVATVGDLAAFIEGRKSA
ncbi:MAG: acyl carrier protein [Kiritimatiellae bacterium]|nr:acyl carrier protein [Kiritimatiellia bacterium]